MGRQALVGCANSKKHEDILDCRQSFFEPGEMTVRQDVLE